MSKTVIRVALAVALAAGLYFVFTSYIDTTTQEGTAETPDTGSVAMPTYTSEKYGVSFSYPSSYTLSERDAEGSAMREHHTITLIATADLPLPVAGEGPPAITIDIYQNDLDALTTENWIRNSAESNFKLSPEGRLASTTIDAKPALSYRWSGLYEGTTIALAQPRWIYAFSVTYLEPGAPIVQDFVSFKETVRIR